MDALDRVSVVRALVPPGKGILATDEGWPAITKRFSALGIESVREQRRLAGQQAIPDRAPRNGAALDGRSTPELAVT
jgi:hypothetical protein